MTSSLYPKDTPLLRDGEKHDPPFVIRWWYNRADTTDSIGSMHILDHIFYDRTRRKWLQDEVWMHEYRVQKEFAPAPAELKAYQGGENDK